MLALGLEPAQVTAVMHRENKVSALETGDIRLMSSMKASSKGNVVLLVVNLGILFCNEYSSMTFIPAKKRMIERVQPAKIRCSYFCQLLIAETENDLVKSPL